MIRSGYIILFSLLIIFHGAHAQAVRGHFFAGSNTITGQDSACILLEDALELLQKSPFSKPVVSWDSLKTAARQQLITASCSKDAYPVINWCVTQVQLNHSFLMPKTTASVYAKDTVTLKRIPALRELVGKIEADTYNDGIGYIRVPHISTTDEATCRLLADSLQNHIRKLTQQGAINWIVDLRYNTGGNCWPMLAGLSGLLGDGICGYFVKPDRRTSIRIENGAAWHNTTSMCRVSSVFTLLPEQKKNIVVLTGPKTSSAGEICAIAFRGLPNVRFMGEATAGYTTGNASYTLMDGSMLILSVCREADRNGIIIEGKLQPNDRIASVTSEDAARSAAVMWLQSF